ncbi:helicase associated domain-containing protein, partial [Streptomyces lunaelactis]|uniref:helicase associated domain-containing protein n=2 Tax=Streptomyces lunaelactis TaxID=1535768 RepID=UPI0035A1BF81
PAPAQEAPAGSPGKASGKAPAAFQRGLTALAQWIEREGTGKPVPRRHLEPLVVEGQEEPVEHRLGVWVSNTKSRRDKLTQPQRDALAQLGVEWTLRRRRRAGAHAGVPMFGWVVTEYTCSTAPEGAGPQPAAGRHLASLAGPG